MKMLLKLRDYMARLEDESVAYVLPNNVLFQIARDLPGTRNQLKDSCRNNMSSMIMKYEDLIIKEIQRKLQSPKIKNLHIKFDTLPQSNTAANEQAHGE